MINREHALKAFKNYVANYDTSNVGVALKIAHTYRVAGLSERIAKSINTNNEFECNVDFAWFLGLLHDIGRFEQVTRYGTFKDALSVDHAEFGADILFRDGLINTFISEDALNELKNTAEIAIRLHNKLKISENLDTQTLLYTKILRDADKIDIFRVSNEPPFSERFSDSNVKNLSVRPEVMQCVMEHRCIPRPITNLQYNELEALIANCCMAFELEFPESQRITIQQGYLNKLLSKDSKQLAIVKAELIKTLKIS